jgi:protoporphyrinogen oxidase
MAGEKRVVILGAGFAGLWLARRLLLDGFQVELLERGAQPGGLMETISRDGFLFDLGPHILLASHMDHYREVLGGDLLRTDGFYGFGYKGKQIPSPLSPGNLLRTLGLGTAVPFAASMAWQKVPFIGPRPPWKSVDEILTRKFGRQVNEAFFRNYIPKITGFPSTRISPDWFLERYRFYQEHSLGRKLWQKVAGSARKLLAGGPGEGSTAGLELYYPRKGAQMLTDALFAMIREQGATVTLQATVDRVETRRGHAVSVGHTAPDGKEGRAEGDFFVSTLPVNHLPRLFRGALGAPAETAAGELSWRHLRLFYLSVDCDRASDKIQIYFTEGKVPFKRIYEPRNLIPSMGRTGQTALCAELCYFDGDDIDRADEGVLAARVKESVCEFYRLPPEKVGFLFSRRVPHAYAVYREGYRSHLGALASAIFPLDNFLSYGRQGSFRYNHLVDRIIDASNSVAGYLSDPAKGKRGFLGEPNPKSDFF